MSENDAPTPAELKQRAKKLKEQEGLTHTASLERAALDAGFASYHDFIQQEKWRRPRRPLQDGLWHELLDGFRAEAASRGVDFSLFWPTPTGLHKSIIDATDPVRLHFALVDLHHYARQPKGPDYKVRMRAGLLRGDYLQDAYASFYRPVTKNGDPRMWFSGLPYFARAGDTIAIVVDDGVPCLINLREIADDVAVVFGADPLFWRSPLDLSFLASHPKLYSVRGLLNLLDRVAAAKQSLALELVGELRKIAARGPLRATATGSTAVGRAVEHALGINQNSSKEPDYKGKIELKAARVKKNPTRQTLFGQVADWGHVKATYKSSAAILEAFGYPSNGLHRLNCSVSALRSNNPGLMFKISDDESLLIEVNTKKNDQVVAVWPLALLASRLLKKHAETFWIKAKSQRDADGVEHFTLLHAIHTKAPVASQLLPLIREGHITMDHLSKRSADGAVTERGPLFKISREGFGLLFPDPVRYELGQQF